MEFKEVMETRRSIRVYEDKEVTDAQINALIHAAQMGPTWKNSQTTRYYVVNKDKALLQQLKELGLPERNTVKVKDAPCLIVVTFVKNVSGHTEGQPDNECGNGWGYYDAGLCSQNLLLAATNEGLGTLVMGIRDADKIREILNISEEEIIVSVLGLGYPAVTPEVNPRKEMDEVVKFL